MCDLAFRRRGATSIDIWPVSVPGRGRHGPLHHLLVEHLDDMERGARLNGGGPRKSWSSGRGLPTIMVERHGARLQVGSAAEGGAERIEPAAAVALEVVRVAHDSEAVRLAPDFEAYTNARHDLVAVRVWVDVDEQAIAAYSAWVVFTLRGGLWAAHCVDTYRGHQLRCRPTAVGSAIEAPPTKAPLGPREPADPKPARIAIEPSACAGDGDCAGDARCCTTGTGSSRCLDTQGGRCPKLPARR